MKTAVDSSVLFDIVKGAPDAASAQAALEAALAYGRADNENIVEGFGEKW